jgi:hypothetical protein
MFLLFHEGSSFSNSSRSARTISMAALNFSDAGSVILHPLCACFRRIRITAELSYSAKPGVPSSSICVCNIHHIRKLWKRKLQEEVLFFPNPADQKSQVKDFTPSELSRSMIAFRKHQQKRQSRINPAFALL